MKKRRIGVLTGGRDCAGLSSGVKWAVKTALDSRLRSERDILYEVLGIHDGWKGLVGVDPAELDEADGLVARLDEDEVRTWDQDGGTLLGTSRTSPYDPNDDQSARALNNIEKPGLDAIVAIGGEDIPGVALRLWHEVNNAIDIPKTTDKRASPRATMP